MRWATNFVEPLCRYLQTLQKDLAASVKEKIRFLEIAYGSLTETLCQLDIALDLGYISEKEFAEEKERINVIGKQLSGLRSSFQKQLEAANR